MIKFSIFVNHNIKTIEMKLIKREGNYTSNQREAKAFFIENYKKGMVLNITATAKALGVTRPTIYAWIKEIEENEENEKL